MLLFKSLNKLTDDGAPWPKSTLGVVKRQLTDSPPLEADLAETRSAGKGVLLLTSYRQRSFYLLGQRFHACFVLKFALQRGEGEKGRECKVNR